MKRKAAIMAALLCGLGFNACSRKAVIQVDWERHPVYQWIRVSFDAETSSELRISDFPDVVFEWSEYAITATENLMQKTLVTGMPVYNAYFTDLTGDGFPELCTTVWFGSGICDQHIIVYDYKNDKEYALWDRMQYDYNLTMKDGRLIVEKRPYISSEQENCETGMLVLDNDTLHFVQDQAEDTAPSTTEAEPEQTEESTTENGHFSSWQEAYTDFIDQLGEKSDYHWFSLIYLDEDEIPELFFNSGGEAGGEFVVTFYEGERREVHLSRTGTKYIAGSGLLYTNTGHMGLYPVTVTKLENGEFSVIGEGVSMFRSDEDGQYILDEDEVPLRDYQWEGKDVSEEEYDAAIDTLFDREQGIWPERQYSVEEMLSLLQTGACTSAGHHYALIQADVTWAEAQALCKEKGGYLATITSPDEQDTVAAQIAQEGMQDISFYVGYRDHEDVGEGVCKDIWINADGSFTLAGSKDGFWKYDAPDFDDKVREWELDNNDCGLVKYYSSTKQIYLFEAPEELLSVSPEYAGRMGYICEFDE